MDTSFKGWNVSATALRWFASDTAHIVFIHITFVVMPVHIFMARNRVSKFCLMTELCFHHFVHFVRVLIYIFGFHHKQSASDLKNFTFVKFASQLSSTADESLKDEMHLLLLWDGLLLTMHTLYLSIYNGNISKKKNNSKR